MFGVMYAMVDTDLGDKMRIVAKVKENYSFYACKSNESFLIHYLYSYSDFA